MILTDLRVKGLVLCLFSQGSASSKFESDLHYLVGTNLLWGKLNKSLTALRSEHSSENTKENAQKAKNDLDAAGKKTEEPIAVENKINVKPVAKFTAKNVASPNYGIQPR